MSGVEVNVKRYPFAPLEVLVSGPLAEAFGADRKQVVRWRQYGLTADQADRLAVRAGFVPYAVWPEWIEDSALVCPFCSSRFVPHDSRQRYCRRDCQVRFNYSTDARRATGRAVMRRRRERPEVREANRAYAAEYRRATRCSQGARESMVA